MVFILINEVYFFLCLSQYIMFQHTKSNIDIILRISDEPGVSIQNLYLVRRLNRWLLMVHDYVILLYVVFSC